MQLQTYAKIGICFGIAGILAAIFLTALIHSHHIREETGYWFIDQDGLIEKFKESEDYLTFTTLYPDYIEEIEKPRDGRVNLEVAAYSQDTSNRLELRYRYDEHELSERISARCDQHNNNYRTSLGTNEQFDIDSSNPDFKTMVPMVMFKEGGVNKQQLVHDFIKYTNCLEIEHPPGHGNNR